MPTLPAHVNIACPACHTVAYHPIAAIRVYRFALDRDGGFAMWCCPACGPVTTDLPADRAELYTRVGCVTIGISRSPELADRQRRHGVPLTASDMLDWLIVLHDTFTVADLLADVPS